MSHRDSLFCLFLPSREAADPAQALESRDTPVVLRYVLGACGEVDATCKLSCALITTGLYREGEPGSGVHRWSRCLAIRIPSLDISFHWPHPNCLICIFIPHQVIVSPFRCGGTSTHTLCEIVRLKGNCREEGRKAVPRTTVVSGFLWARRGSTMPV